MQDNIFQFIRKKIRDKWLAEWLGQSADSLNMQNTFFEIVKFYKLTWLANHISTITHDRLAVEIAENAIGNKLCESNDAGPSQIYSSHSIAIMTYISDELVDDIWIELNCHGYPKKDIIESKLLLAAAHFIFNGWCEDHLKMMAIEVGIEMEVGATKNEIVYAFLRNATPCSLNLLLKEGEELPFEIVKKNIRKELIILSSWFDCPPSKQSEEIPKNTSTNQLEFYYSESSRMSIDSAEHNNPADVEEELWIPSSAAMQDMKDDAMVTRIQSRQEAHFVYQVMVEENKENVSKSICIEDAEGHILNSGIGDQKCSEVISPSVNTEIDYKDKEKDKVKKVKEQSMEDSDRKRCKPTLPNIQKKHTAVKRSKIPRIKIERGKRISTPLTGASSIVKDEESVEEENLGFKAPFKAKWVKQCKKIPNPTKSTSIVAEDE